MYTAARAINRFEHETGPFDDIVIYINVNVRVCRLAASAVNRKDLQIRALLSL